MPGFEDTRIALLERALAFYGELAAEQPGDVAPRAEHARTQRSIGDILLQLGRRDEARPILVGVVATLRDLVAESPDDGELIHMLAGCLSQVGTMDQDAGRLDEALASYLEGLALLDGLISRPAPHPSWLRDHVVTCMNLARLANDSGDDEEELRLFLLAADTAKSLHDEHPESVDYAIQFATALKGAATAGVAIGRAEESERMFRTAFDTLLRYKQGNPRDRALRNEIAESANSFGLLLMTRADRSEALAVLTEGLSAARSLARDFPREPMLGQNAAVLGLNVAAELGNQKRIADAVPIIEESCETLSRLAAEHSENLQYSFYLGAAQTVASGMHLKLGDAERAWREAQDSVANLREMHAAVGSSNEVASQLASALFQLADVHRSLQDLDEALAVSEEAFELGGWRPDILFQAAQITGQLAVDARAADELAIAERAEELCLAMLDEAVAKGFSDRTRLNDAEFASLQGVEAFEAIAARAGPAP